MLMEFIVLSLHIFMLAQLTDSSVLDQIMSKLVELEEDHFVAKFHQQVQKARENAWNDKHIKWKKFHMGDMVFCSTLKISKWIGWVCIS